MGPGSQGGDLASRDKERSTHTCKFSDLAFQLRAEVASAVSYPEILQFSCNSSFMMWKSQQCLLKSITNTFKLQRNMLSKWLYVVFICKTFLLAQCLVPMTQKGKKGTFSSPQGQETVTVQSWASAVWNHSIFLNLNS